MHTAITSGTWGWLGRLTMLTAAIIITVFMIWEIVMGFTNQIFKWVGDVANDLGENKANNAFIGVASGAKGASTQMATAAAIKGDGGGGGGGGNGPEKSGDSPEEGEQATDAGDQQRINT
ncbi:MAG: hypothetical protein Q9M12_08395 [Mariprofundus sp.]|nr:hypothetical protein [Mariprofundus sp.]